MNKDANKDNNEEKDDRISNSSVGEPVKNVSSELLDKLKRRNYKRIYPNLVDISRAFGHKPLPSRDDSSIED